MTKSTGIQPGIDSVEYHHAELAPGGLWKRPDRCGGWTVGEEHRKEVGESVEVLG